MKSFFQSSSEAKFSLLVLTILYFLECFDRYLIAVSPIPYIDYSSYEYSVLVGPAFGVIYGLGGLLIALSYRESKLLIRSSTDINSHHDIDGEGLATASEKRNGKSLPKSCATTFYALIRSPYGILFFSTLVFSVAFGATALCTTFWQQALLRLVMGLAQSVITPFASTIISDFFPPELRGSAFGIFNVGVYFAFSLSLSLGVWIYNEYGWKAGYLLFGIIGTFCSFFVPFLACCKNKQGSNNSATLVYNPLSKSEDAFSDSFPGAEDADAEEPRVSEQSINGLAAKRGGVPTYMDPVGIPQYIHHQKPTSFSSTESFESITIERQMNAATVHPGTTGTGATSAAGRGSGAISPNKDTNNNKNNKNNDDEDDIRDPLFDLDDINELSTTSEDFMSLRSSSFDSNHSQRGYCCTQSMLRRIKRRLLLILFVYWRKQPSIVMLCLATGVRLGAGYIWSSYTGVFFSSLFASQENSIECAYSYDAASEGVDGTGMCSSSDFPYCVDKVCKSLNEYPWHNKGMEPIHLIEYMSWVPLVGSAFGNLLGGFLSDWVIRFNNKENTVQTKESIAIRALISGLTTLLAVPFISLSFFLGLPGCFLIYIASGMIGEVYWSQTLALITDRHFIPASLSSSSVALFMLFITLIGGNAPFLIPLLSNWIFTKQITISFSAASSDTTTPASNVEYRVENSDARQLQYSIWYSLLGCYTVSGVLYILAYRMMRRSK